MRIPPAWTPWALSHRQTSTAWRSSNSIMTSTTAGTSQRRQTGIMRTALHAFSSALASRLLQVQTPQTYRVDMNSCMCAVGLILGVWRSLNLDWYISSITSIGIRVLHRHLCLSFDVDQRNDNIASWWNLISSSICYDNWQKWSFLKCFSFVIIWKTVVFLSRFGCFLPWWRSSVSLWLCCALAAFAEPRNMYDCELRDTDIRIG